MKNPYKFPARSRADMIAAMEAIGGRYDRREHYPFAWNVKIYGCGDMSAAALQETGAGTFNPQWDSAWQEHAEKSDSLFWVVCERAGDYYLRDYCTWPGDDQGDYEFEFMGRSGGWLVLTKWQGRSMRNFHIADECAADSYAGLAWPEVRALYRAVMTMNQDLTPEKVLAEFRYHMGDARAQWEERRRESIDSEIAAQREAAATARELLGELRAARAIGAGLASVPAICGTIRAAIRERIQLARRSRRTAAALIAGESLS